MQNDDKNQFLDDESAIRPSLINVILLNRTLKIAIILITVSIIIPVAIHLTFFSNNGFLENYIGVCSIPTSHQINCGETNITLDECHKLKCCMSSEFKCYHTLPSRYQYVAKDGTFKRFLPTESHSPFQTEMRELQLEIIQVSSEILEISLENTKIIQEKRASNNDTISDITNSLYDFKLYDSMLFLDVFRKDKSNKKKLIFTTSRGPLIMSDNYFEWTFGLNCSMIFGLDSLNLTEGRRFLINDGVENAIPYIIGYEHSDQSYFALYFAGLNSPTEIEILKSNTIIVRSMSGVSFSLKVFMGPHLNDVYRQIGNGREMPLDFWQLGVHVCKMEGGTIEEAAEEVEELLKGFPFDSHCIDSSLVYSLSLEPDEKTVTEIQKSVEKLKEKNRKFLLHLYSHLLADESSEIFREAASNNLLLKLNETEIYEGLDPNRKKISYFDYITKHSEISDLVSKYKHKIELLNANGYFTDLNFPFDYLENQTHSYLDDFEFVPNNFANHLENLIPLNTKLANNESFINVLNQYSSKQIEMFSRVFSPDLFISDSYNEHSSVGALIKTSRLNWVDFRKVVYKLVFMATVNFKFYGSLVCGVVRAIPEDLCVRWYQFSAFVPLFLVDSQKLPGVFTINVRRMIIEAVKTRYTFLYYMNSEILFDRPILTLMHSNGTLLNDQFLFGNSLLIAPVIYQSAREVKIYFPENFYEIWSGLEMPVGKIVQFAVVLNDIPIFIRAGHTIALSEISRDNISTYDLKEFPLYLIIALDCDQRYHCTSEGELKFTPSLSLTFNATEKRLEIKVTHNSPNITQEFCGDNLKLPSIISHVKIYGLEKFKNKHKELNLNLCASDLSKSIIYLL